MIHVMEIFTAFVLMKKLVSENSKVFTVTGDLTKKFLKKIFYEMFEGIF